MSENQNGLYSPIIICGEPEKDPARFPCISLGEIQADTPEEMEKAWRLQLKHLSSLIQESTYKKLSISEQRILRSLGNERAGIIPDTFWGLRTFCKAYAQQSTAVRYYVEGYDAPLIKAIRCGYGRQALELIRTILYAVIGDMNTEVQILCRFPLEPGSGFRRQVRQYDLEEIQPIQDEERIRDIYSMAMEYMDDHFEEAVELVSGLLQRDYVEYTGDFWLSGSEPMLCNSNDMLTILYYSGWLEKSVVNGHYYMRIHQEGLKYLKALTAAYMDHLSGMENSAAWVRWVLKHKDNGRLRAMLETLELDEAEKILRLAILSGEGNYRIYSWRYPHRQQLYILAVDGDHRNEAYAIAIAGSRNENRREYSRSEMYLKLRQKIRRLPTYKWVQGERNLVELTLVLFTNE